MNTQQIKELYLKYRLFIYPIALGLASLFLIILVIVPQIQAFLEGQNNLNEIKGRAATLDAKAAELSSIDATELDRNLNLAVQSLPTDKDYGSIIGLIQKIAADSGVSVSSLGLNSLVGSKTQGFIVNLSLVGPKVGVDLMLQNIDKSPRIMKVAEIDISSSKTDGTVEANLTINAFYAPAPKSLGSVDAELPKLTSKDKEILATLASSSISAAAPTVTTGQLLPRGKTNPFQ